MSRERSVWRIIVQNFKKSLSILPPEGKFMGEDQAGNKYFEATESHVTSRKHPTRWFEPLKEGDWQQNLPAEWEAWLRNRRRYPPTTEEVLKNAAIAEMKKIKGDEIREKADQERGMPPPEEKVINRGFPKLEGLETLPGKSQDEIK